MTIDLLASEPHYLAHLLPVWHALPAAVRGTVYVAPRMLAAAPDGALPRPARLGDGPPLLVASWQDHRRGRDAGRLVAEAQHGIGQSYGGTISGYPGGTGRAPGSLFLCPNEHSAQRWRAAYADATVVVVGSPVLDTLPAYEPDDGPPVVAVTFHWSASGLPPEARWAFEPYSHAVAQLARSHRVIGHAHPRAMGALRSWWRRHQVPVLESFHDVCRQAAVLVFDNTSAGYEFASTGRPVVVLNRPTRLGRSGRISDAGYRPDVRHGLRFWSAAEVGVNVWQPDQLAAAVDEALADPPVRALMREQALRVVYAYRHGAAGRSVDALLRWLDGATVTDGAEQAGAA